jgi:hypothetical protein
MQLTTVSGLCQLCDRMLTNQAVHPELANSMDFFREIDNFEIAVGTLIEAIETDLSHVRAPHAYLCVLESGKTKNMTAAFSCVAAI